MNTKKHVLLVNAKDNPDARFEPAVFEDWAWTQTEPGWKPEDGAPVSPEELDAIAVFSTKYQEREIRQLCERIAEQPWRDKIPLLVAVNQYEMPLANDVKKLPHADFMITPVREADLARRIEKVAEAPEA